MDKVERQDKVKEYIQFNKRKTEKYGTPAPSSYNPMISSIMSFCEANELDMNWKLIKKAIPKITSLSNQYPYLNEDIEKMLSVAGILRDVAFIHLMSSCAPRIGEVNLIKIKDIEPIEDGAILRMYPDTLDEYKVPMTPEAWTSIKNYLESRAAPQPDDLLFVTKSGERPMKRDSIREFMKTFRDKIEVSRKDGKRKNKAPNNAFRKRLQICYSNGKVDPRYADYFLNHNLGKQDGHYFRRMTNEEIWQAFKNAIPCITLDKSKKIEAQKNDDIQVIKDAHKQQLEEVVVNQGEMIQDMRLQLASVKYFACEARYSECFGGKNPDLEKLSKLMSNEEVEDWNKFIPLVQRTRDWTISKGTSSEQMLRDSKQKREIRELIKKFKKRGDSEGTIKQLKEMLKELENPKSESDRRPEFVSAYLVNLLENSKLSSKEDLRLLDELRAKVNSIRN
ncbi:MAG: tyrosine-type recombinase/integrase [Nitrosopumilus sp.]|nr:tyrosine-type recombinase/integrase [Nitrosopumilus sp.]